MTDAELSYARELARWAKKHALLENVLGGFAAKSGAVPQAPPGSDAVARSAMLRKGAGKGRRLVRVEEMCADTFCDIQAEVRAFVLSVSRGSIDPSASLQIVKFYKPFGGSVGPFDACSLFITDYTTNDQLYAYSDTSEVRTPGQVTLQVSIFGAQNDPLLSLSEDKLVGRLVYLRNVRPKMTLNDFLEATMVEDGKYPERRDVRLLRENNTTKEWRDAFKACVSLTCSLAHGLTQEVCADVVPRTGHPSPGATWGGLRRAQVARTARLARSSRTRSVRGSSGYISSRSV